MKVYSLTGKSGTGKSFQAINLCVEKNIESIIDDGLFIYENRVVAGISAKRQKTAVGAIKTALFTTDEHRDQVAEKIKEINPKSILIIGTSDKMAEKIVARLGIGPIEERIYIEDITTEKEREIAKDQRYQQGKHIIPVPAPQLKRDFAGYFVDPFRFFRERNVQDKASRREKTVVRPTYSYMGDFYISDTVFTDIVNCVSQEFDAVSRVVGVYENTSPDNLIMEVVLCVKKGNNVWDTAKSFQRKVASVVSTMTAYNVVRIDIEVRAIM